MAKQQNYPPKKEQNVDLSPYIFGKVMPQAIPLEEAVLGATMLEKDVLGSIIDLVEPETFYLDAHQHIYRAILDLHKNRFPVDILTVTEALKKAGNLEKIGGAYYLTELTSRVGSSANIEYHAKILAQKRMQRQIVGIASSALQDAYNDMVDPFEHLASMMSDLAKVNPSIVGNVEPISTVAMRWLKDIEERSSNPDAGKGVMSGIPDLDKLIGGFLPGNLVLVGARPGMGKSALVNSLSMNMGAAHKKVMVFSMEMTKSELANRLISAISGVTLSELKDPSRLEPTQWQALQTAIEIVQQYPILYSDVSAMKPMMIRKEIEKHQPDIVFIDYLGLMSPDYEKRNDTTNETISSISRELKNIAKDFDVPVIALSQLNRSVETRGGAKRPQLSDLRDSGSLEQNADIVIFLYRPEYYQITEDDQGNSLKNLAEIIVAKQRNGALDTVKCTFSGPTTQFLGLADNPHYIYSPIKRQNDEDIAF